MSTERTLTSIPKNFTLILYHEGAGNRQVVKRVETRSQAKFTRRLKLINSQVNACLRVSYVGGGWNVGYFFFKNDLMAVYKAFIER